MKGTHFTSFFLFLSLLTFPIAYSCPIHLPIHTSFGSSIYGPRIPRHCRLEDVAILYDAMIHQHEHVPRNYSLEAFEEGTTGIKSPSHDSAVNLVSADQGYDARFTFEVIRPNMFRTTFSTADHPLPPHPSSAKPESSLGNVSLSSTSSDKRKRIVLGSVTAVVEWADAPVVSLYLEGEKKPIHRDLNFRSYAVDSSGIAHYTAYKRDTLHVGLGEKAAPMNLSNRHFIISATDCFGYDVYRTDPMYKHIPLLINATPKGCIAIFSTSHSRGTWSVGSEVDGLWGHYKVYRQAHGGLEEYLIVGRTVKDVVKTYADLVGYPRLVPRWALGYISGGMKYSMLDKPRACDVLLDFAAKLKLHDIPCSAFQLSSGYTVSEEEPKTRNVFTWNSHRFPDPQAFTAAYHAAGIRIIANIKPYILGNHPEYNKLAQANALFTNPATGKTAVARLWSAGGGESGEGSHIDFTSSAAFEWWFNGVKTLKAVGIDAMWNDNNEYVIPDDDWKLALESQVSTSANLSDSRNYIGLWGRAMQTELMAKASHDALVDAEPEIRPFVLTRSATAGTMRYAASSWSGDNVTSWDSMKGANALALNAGVSLLQSYGHDIGGFEGPQPSPELLLRWVQLGIYSPRFAINCYKTSPADNLVGDVIEPWMFPAITPMIRDTIKRRYELIPYLYSSALESHLYAIPPQRWVGWGYESDPEVWTSALLKGEAQYWLGDTLLIGGVYEPGLSTSRIYLPWARHPPPTSSEASGITSSRSPNLESKEGYVNLNAPYQYLSAGQWVTIESPWQMSIPVLAKIGGAIPTGKPAATSSPLEQKAEFLSLVADDYRAIEIFPPKGSSDGHTWKNTWYEDDGLSAKPNISSFTVSYSSTAASVVVTIEKYIEEDGGFHPLWKQLHIILPVLDERVVTDFGGKTATDIGRDSRGRRVFKISVT